MIADQIRAFRLALETACAERIERSAHATGLFCDTIPNVYDLNFLRADDPPAAIDELDREADELMPRFLHRKIEIEHGGESLVDGFERAGFTPVQHIAMAHRRTPDRLVDTATVRELSFESLSAARETETLGRAGGDLKLTRSLDAGKRRVLAAVSTRFFAAMVDGQVAAYCELRSGDRVAQIEDVNTFPAFRGLGLGLGRVVVQYALVEAQRQSRIVHLEALADDWPRQLYAKLGFDVVDDRWLFLKPGHALTRLRLRTPRLELRLATDAELRELALVAQAGIHDPAATPFYVPWTDNSDRPGFVDEFVEHHRAALRDWRPDGWSLQLVAFLNGRPIGVQGIRSKRFAETLTVDSGSWLGKAWQRHGLGTEMRAAVLTLAFEGRGAARATSGAIGGNPASLGVSRKLGYREIGTKPVAPRGAPLEELVLELRREEFSSPVPVDVSGLDDLHSQFESERLA